MLDDYGLRLLAEIGIDVYQPKARPAAATVAGAARPAALVVLACASSTPVRLVDDLERALRASGLRMQRDDGLDAAALAAAAAVLVLGGDLARAIGAGLPAQRQRELEWVVVAEADALARDAAGKRALWGEIKRLARSGAGRHGMARA